MFTLIKKFFKKSKKNKKLEFQNKESRLRSKFYKKINPVNIEKAEIKKEQKKPIEKSYAPIEKKPYIQKIKEAKQKAII